MSDFYAQRFSCFGLLFSSTFSYFCPIDQADFYLPVFGRTLNVRISHLIVFDGTSRQHASMLAMHGASFCPLSIATKEFSTSASANV